MLLDRDEFLVTYDPAQADTKRLIATIKDAGYTAQLITSNPKPAVTTGTISTLPRGFALLDEALSKAQAENKPIVLDFHAEWCAPCLRMEKATFADATVKALLERCVVVKIDTDQAPDLAQQLGVEGLPDIRFVSPEGKIIRQLRNYQTAESFIGELERLLQTVIRK